MCEARLRWRDRFWLGSLDFAGGRFWESICFGSASGGGRRLGDAKRERIVVWKGLEAGLRSLLSP